jgi:hypothetical protein
LHTVTSARIVPGKGILTAGDKTGTALQATLVIYDHLTVLIELVEVSGTNVKTKTDLAASLANLLVDEDMRLLTIDLENV